jgi:phosphoribosylamine--glycine ligase
MLKNILVIGNGGREHAIVKTLKRSKNIGKLYCTPSNAGIEEDAIKPDINANNFQDIANFCKTNQIDFVVVGPEQPLVDGIVNFLNEQNIKVFGPDKVASQLEGSKEFMKKIVSKYGVPTAEYQSFTDKDKAIKYLNTKQAPIVIKADGLAAGKGVTVAMTKLDALKAVEDAFSGKFGEAGQKIVIEEFLEGEEASFFVLCDGVSFLEFGFAQDHKRAFDNDTGPNTGGMGTYSPAPIVTDSVREKTIEKIIKPTINGLIKEGIIFKGFLFAGLMIDKNGDPKLLEYNIRLGDPETQVILTRLKSDFIDLIEKTIEGRLSEEKTVEFSDDAAVCVVYATKGYPEEYKKGYEINLNGSDKLNNVSVFHAGTKKENGVLKSNGGRVLGITATGKNIKQAQQNSYNAISQIKFEGGFYRKDIANKAL